MKKSLQPLQEIAQHGVVSNYVTDWFFGESSSHNLLLGQDITRWVCSLTILKKLTDLEYILNNMFSNEMYPALLTSWFLSKNLLDD